MRIVLLGTSLLVLAALACTESVAPIAGSPASDGGVAEGGVVAAPVGAANEPEAQFIPKVTGSCPEFAKGKATFDPGGKPRDVQMWIGDAAKTLDGPLVFFWHGAGGSPTEASFVLGSAIDEITALGGVVVAPYHDPGSGLLPWFLALGGTAENDLLVADEVVACAIAKVGIDRRRIHSVGFSAGAMHTTQFAVRRSGYLASIVAYSPARLGTPPDPQDGKNKYPAMLLYGGDKDTQVISFAETTRKYHGDLTAEGHFSVLCNHGGGHTVPSSARPSAWKFLEDHPFKASPEPYAKTLPESFPKYCALGPAQ